MGSCTLDVRPEVAAFALLMEAKLRENDHKGSWKGEATSYLSRRCGNELDELRAALRTLNAYDGMDANKRLGYRATVAREAADVANFAMMIADACGGLDTTTPTKPGGTL